jgi:hypothetical protein
MGQSKACVEERDLFQWLDEAWGNIVKQVRSGAISFKRGLERFRILLQRCIDQTQRISQYQISFPTPVFRPTELTVDQRFDLFQLNEAWDKLVAEFFAKPQSFRKSLQRFDLLLEKFIEVRWGKKDRPILTSVEDLMANNQERPSLNKGEPAKATLQANPFEYRSVEDRVSMETEFYARFGVELRVPAPVVTLDQLNKWCKEGKDIFWRPGATDASFIALMIAWGHEDHWMVKDNREAQEMIVFEPTEQGYWFLTDVQEDCPRLGENSYQEFSESLTEGEQLLSLEEYVIIWHALEHTSGAILDVRTYTLLRNKCRKGGILYALGNVTERLNEFLVRHFPDLVFPKMGARICRKIPSV